MAEINKKTLEYLAELGKIRVDHRSEEKLIKDLGSILKYFEELKEVDTDGVEPLAGGTIRENVLREDEIEKNKNYEKTREKIKKAFPEEKEGFLKVPPVFE